MTTWPATSTPCTWKTDFAISRPIVEIDCIGCSSESWEPSNGAHSLALSCRWRSRPQHQKRKSLRVAAFTPNRTLGVAHRPTYLARLAAKMGLEITIILEALLREDP